MSYVKTENALGGNSIANLYLMGQFFIVMNCDFFALTIENVILRIQW